MNWKAAQRIRGALAKAGRQGQLRKVWTPTGPVFADSPTLSRIAKAITGVDAGTVTIESITDAAHPTEDPWTRRWNGSTP